MKFRSGSNRTPSILFVVGSIIWLVFDGAVEDASVIKSGLSSKSIALTPELKSILASMILEQNKNFNIKNFIV